MNNSDRKPPAASLSVVLPTCGRLVRLRACLEALLASPDPILAEIVVVADGLRTDQRQELENLLARYADSGVRCIEGPGRGPGFARNAGVAASRGALIAFLDDDCLPAPGWLTRLAAIFGEAEAPDVVGGPVLPVFERPALAAALQPHYEHRILQARDQTFPSSVFQPFGIPITANLALRKAWFLRVGGFPEACSWLADDVALHHLLVRAGARVEYRKDLLVKHVYSESWPEILHRKLYRYGRADALALRTLFPATLVLELRLPGREGWTFQRPLRRGSVYLSLDAGKLGSLGLLWPPWGLVGLAGLALAPPRLRRWYYLGTASLALQLGRLRGSWEYHVMCF
ncbi:MAG: hypothetical protein A2284_00405 [Deltaproteobacteria bacterium RIFOXYA12_FULL_61_11]|nr:MAG: hypothetical protein A2284_00405 [Deltaproteobacteria bacterium RIFOXYA12_FULL_61_11]